jgi:ATP-dependent helicase/DNAse subunit B
VLYVGPPLSGKSHIILHHFRAALAARQNVRLLVPTATMANHVRNSLTREGLLLRSQQVQTLSAFAAECLRDTSHVRSASEFLLRHRLRQLLVATPEDYPVLAGLLQEQKTQSILDSLARLAKEVDRAGLLTSHLQQKATELYSDAATLEVTRLLMALEARLRVDEIYPQRERMEVAGEHLPALDVLLLDGFFRLSWPEAYLLSRLPESVELSLALPRAEEVPGLLRSRSALQELPPQRELASAVKLEARTREHEAELVCERMLRLAAEGVRWRDMAVILRAPDKYEAALRRLMPRFGIPVHFYCSQALKQQAAVRCLLALLRAAAQQWDHDATLQACDLWPAPPWSPAAIDALRTTLIARTPNRGLLPFEALNAWQNENGESLLEPWAKATVSAAEWSRQAMQVFELLKPMPEERSAMQLALQELTAALGEKSKLSATDFALVLRDAVATQQIYAPPSARNVVAVMDAEEARQWQLPYVFVCGAIEEEFPQFASPAPLLSNDLRREVFLRTVAESMQAEELLFQLTTTRATQQLCILWPATDGVKGDPLLFSRSFAAFCEQVQAEEIRAVFPQPPLPPAMSPRLQERLYREHLQVALAKKAERLSASAIETWLSCPWKFFGQRMLRLEKLKLRPDDRLDHLQQGQLVHKVLEKWQRQPHLDIASLLSRAFDELLLELSLPATWRTEQIRLQMLRSLQEFAQVWSGPQTSLMKLEESFVFPLLMKTDADEVSIVGKIDRYDVSHGEAQAYDYKYSSASNTEKRTKASTQEDSSAAQAGLYLAALAAKDLKPTSLQFYALNSDEENKSLAGEALDTAREQALEKARKVVLALRAGDIRLQPHATEKPCKYCDFSSSCRFSQAAAGADEDAAEA